MHPARFAPLARTVAVGVGSGGARIVALLPFFTPVGHVSRVGRVRAFGGVSFSEPAERALLSLRQRASLVSQFSQYAGPRRVQGAGTPLASTARLCRRTPHGDRRPPSHPQHDARRR
eukprot:3680560-Prymnesium_polylepis.1